MDRYQYRISSGDAVQIYDTYPSAHWAWASESAEARGVGVVLERRLITDVSILPLLGDKEGYRVLGFQVLCPWEVFASV